MRFDQSDGARKLAIGFGGTAGLVVMGLMMYVAWQHNAQGEIHDSDQIHWGYWFFIGASWFVPTSILIAFATFVVLRLAKAVRRGSSATKE